MKVCSLQEGSLLLSWFNIEKSSETKRIEHLLLWHYDCFRLVLLSARDDAAGVAEEHDGDNKHLPLLDHLKERLELPVHQALCEGQPARGEKYWVTLILC